MRQSAEDLFSADPYSARLVAGEHCLGRPFLRGEGLESLTMTAALERLLAIEVTANQARRPAGRRRFASLPIPVTLDDFDYDAAPAVDPHLIAELATCRYLETPPTSCSSACRAAAR